MHHACSRGDQGGYGGYSGTGTVASLTIARALFLFLRCSQAVNATCSSRSMSLLEQALRQSKYHPPLQLQSRQR